LAGAFTKSAQVPFHFWLPNAMAAPTPVSAYLHSATMVKAGVFLLARLNPGLGGSEVWGWTLAVTGSLTLLLAVALGTFQTDLKRILAYTTLAVLGMLTMLLGLGSEIAVKAMVVFLLGHALYKAALFMTAGSIDHETGTRDVRVLGGLAGLMPVTAFAAGLAALSKSGFPPFIGFLGKEYVYKTGVALEGASGFFLAVAFIGNLLVMAMALNAGIGPFLGRRGSGKTPKKPHEAPPSMWLGPLLLGLSGLAIGLFPGLVSDRFVGPAIAAVKGVPIEPLELKLWHGVNIPLLIGLATLAGGMVAFSFRRWIWHHGLSILPRVARIGAEAAYEKCFDAVVRFSKFQTRVIQTGRLHDYVFAIVLTTAGFLLWAVVRFGGPTFPVDRGDFDPLMAGLIVLMAAAALVAVGARTYVAVLVALGIVGFGIALIFGYYGAPDLAITQLLVETLTVVLFMFVLLRLPSLKTISGRMTRLRDALLAAVFGGLISVLVLKAVSIQFDHAISGRLAEMSYPEAKGRNVVNVILVDFRALDTMGEIVVIAVAALGIAALVTVGRKKGKGERA
jgi:multicomponent Na+:H+ antiporter subunit A